MLDYREQFEKEPLVWSLGALSAGFALDYTLGYAHKTTKKGKHSQVAQFADRIVDELSTAGQSLVMPPLNVKIKISSALTLVSCCRTCAAEKKQQKQEHIDKATAEVTE